MWLRVGAIVLAAFAGVACAGMQARTQPEGPPLDVPPPPAPAPAAIEAGVDGGRDASAAKPAPPAASSRRPHRSTPPPATKPAAGRKADTPDKTELPPAAPVKPAADAPAPPPSLQTTANVGELEQKIRLVLDRAAHDLEKIDARTLGADARAQFDEAKRFAEQANAALKVKNLVFAEQLADKAAALAASLAKR